MAMKPQLINFMGAPGVGKTTLARRLSQEQGIYFFEREVVLNSIFADERDTPRYNEWAGKITKSTCPGGNSVRVPETAGRTP